MQIAAPSPGFAPDLNLKSQNLRIESNLKLALRDSIYVLFHSSIWSIPCLARMRLCCTLSLVSQKTCVAVWRSCVDYTSQTATSFLLNEGHVNLAESHHYHLNILISLLSFEALQHPWFWWCLGLNQGPSAKLLDELCLQGGFHSALPCYCTGCTGCTGCTLFARICNVQNSHTKQWSIMRYTRYYQSFNDSMYSRSSRSPSSRTFFSRSVMLLKAPLPPLFESNIRECKYIY